MNTESLYIILSKHINLHPIKLKLKWCSPGVMGVVGLCSGGESCIQQLPTTSHFRNCIITQATTWVVRGLGLYRKV